MIQIRKTYDQVNPELLYADLRDFIAKQGVTLKENRLETFTLPDQSAAFISRGTLTFMSKGEADKEAVRVHLVGTVRGETKLMLDIDETLFPQAKISALLSDVDFIFSPYEVK